MATKKVPSAPSAPSASAPASAPASAVSGIVLDNWNTLPKYIQKARDIENKLGEEVRIASKVYGDSMRVLGRLILQASKCESVIVFGLHNWLQAYGVSEATKSSVSADLRLAKCEVACLASGIAPVGDRVARIVAREVKALGLDSVELAPKEMIEKAIIESKVRKPSVEAKKDDSIPSNDSKPTGDTSKPNASADPADFVKNWKAEAVAFILNADQSQLVHIMQVCSTLILSADGRLTADSRKSMKASKVKA